MSRTPALALLLAVAAGGCCDRRAAEADDDSVAVAVAREELARRAQAVREAFADGAPDAVERCRALGEDALTAGEPGAAAEVAWIYIEEQRYGDALSYLDRADAVYPSSAGVKDLLYPRAAALDAVGRTAEAAAIYSSALAIEPTNPFEYTGAADLWVAAGDLDRAARTVETGLDRFPGEVVLLQARAEVALRGGDAAGALGQLDALAQDHPYEVGVLVLRLEALAVLDRREELRAAARSFDEDYPALGFGPVFLGLAAARDGDAGTAEEEWRRAAAVIAACEICAGDEADVLRWAREQAGAQVVAPLPR